MDIASILEWVAICPPPPPGDVPNLGIELESLMSPALGGRFFNSSVTWEALFCDLFEKTMMLGKIEGRRRRDRG